MISLSELDRPARVLPQEEHFRTDHLVADLRRRTISSGILTMAAQALKLLINVGGIMVLARLLSPRDFGLIGIVTGVTAYLSIFTDVGLSSATIQSDTLTQAQVSNLFWTNVAVSALVGLLTAGLAPVVAWFYHEPRLLPITLVIACAFPLNGLALQHRAILARQMRFRMLANIEVGSLLASVAVGCELALLHSGVWALVGMQVALALSGCALTWLGSNWRPSLPRRHQGTGGLLSFGLDLTASNLIYRMSRGCDTLLLGKFWGAEQTGLYTRAAALLARPLDQIISPISAVLLPVLSRLQSDSARYRRTYLQAYEAIGLVSFPLMAMLMADRHPLVQMLLGRRWDSAAEIFGGFTFVALYLPLAASVSWLFTTQGRSRDLLRCNIILGILTAASFVGGVRYGVVPMVLTYSLSGLFVRLPILYYFAGRHGPVQTRDLWRGLLRHVPLWAAVYGASSLALDAIPHAGRFESVVFPLAAGLTVAAAVTLIIGRQRQSAIFLINLFKNARGNTPGLEA